MTFLIVRCVTYSYNTNLLLSNLDKYTRNINADSILKESYSDIFTSKGTGCNSVTNSLTI